METTKPLEVDALNHLTASILDASISVHKEVGPGLLENVYHHCLIDELMQRRMDVRTMVPVSLVYKGRQLNKDYVIDLIVEGEVIVELKAIESILPVHEAQLLSYLRLTNKRVALSRASDASSTNSDSANPLRLRASAVNCI